MTYDTFDIPGGDAGVHATLALMRQLVNDAVNDPAVVRFARQLAIRAAVRHEHRQAVSIRAWLERVWRFVHDPIDREMISDVSLMLDEFQIHGVITGDCDDAAVLGAALGKAIGLRAQFVVYGFASGVPDEPDTLAHVFAVLLTDSGGVVNLDITRPRGPVPAPTRIVIADV